MQTCQFGARTVTYILGKYEISIGLEAIKTVSVMVRDPMR